MPAFLPVAFLDTWELAASLRSRMGLFGKGEPPLLLPIRGPKRGTEEEDEDWTAYPPAAKWAELKALLSRMTRLADAAGLGKIEFGRIFFELLQPGQATPWQRESGAYSASYARTHLALRTNPQALIVAGGEAQHLLPGNLTIIARKLPVLAVNAGEWPRIHLVCDLRRQQVTDNQQ